MKNLSSALLWSGASLILLPIGLICLLGTVALCIANPIVGLIALTVLVLIGRAIYDGRKQRGSEGSR